MDIAEKIGIAITALGGLIDVAEVFFPGAIGSMTKARRVYIFGCGTLLVVTGLAVIFLSPPGNNAKGSSVTQASGGSPTPTIAQSADQSGPQSAITIFNAPVIAPPAHAAVIGNCSGNVVTGRHNTQNNHCGAGSR